MRINNFRLAWKYLLEEMSLAIKAFWKSIDGICEMKFPKKNETLIRELIN